jgi:hypothetical protein
MLSATMQSVIILNVVAPLKATNIKGGAPKSSQLIKLLGLFTYQSQKLFYPFYWGEK